MSLNLNKHGSAMQAAWKEVRDNKSATNWALFGYEGQTFDLKLVSKGEDGIDELKDDLNASRIMYGFIRVEDPKTSLPKFVFLHWQGESVPGTRKGLAATHLRDIEKYFHGASLTLNARTEDEVEEEDIIAKVSKVSSSSYNFKEPQTAMEAPVGPVGTAYQKINPKAELPNLDEREKFWNSEENREKERIALEKERKKSEVKQLEQERRAREEREAAAREAAIREKEKKISMIKDSEAKTLHSPDDDAKKWEAQQALDAEDEATRRNRAEELKKQRNEEAKKLIGQRSQGARAVFERNSSVGQLNFRKPSVPSNKIGVATAPPPKVVEEERIAAPKEAEDVVNANEVSTEDMVVPPPESFGNDDNHHVSEEPGEIAANAEPVNDHVVHPDVTVSHQPDIIQDVAAKQGPDLTSSAIGARDDSPKKEAVNGAEFGICAMALYDYQAADETEISFDPGQLITHIDQIDPGWWQGLGPDGSYGLFPANYVEVVEASTASNSS